jgi:hypothetical protein
MPTDLPYRFAMELNGLPLHPLVVHAAVILAPTAALTSIGYAFLPGWRWLLRWPMVALAAAAAATVYVAKLSGDALMEARFSGDIGELGQKIETHSDRGDLLVWIALGFFVSTLFAAQALGGPSGLVSGKGARESSAVSMVALVLVVVGALAVVVMAFLTGDAGARAVWEL